MTPDALFAADEARHIATSRALTSLTGANVRCLTPDEAALELANHAYERRETYRKSEGRKRGVA
jgi:hypothetical protein